MATEQFKAEVDAIGAILEHLEPLTGPARARVIDYVLRALSISRPDIGEPVDGNEPLTGPPPNRDPSDAGHGSGPKVQDIRSLHDEKQPKTAIEMAAIVGYYLSEVATGEERKDAIETADLERYFKHARYPLPSKIRAVLGNAAAAGYFDLVDRGRYRLNPVGHNLVVHNLPSSEATATPRRRVAKKTAGKKTAAKKTAANKTAS